MTAPDAPRDERDKAALRAARAEECASIVAWLNRQALFSYGEPFLKEAAAAIARGEHRSGDAE